MRRRLTAAAVGLLAACAAAPAAEAATRQCRIGYYAPGLDQGSPAVSDLRAVDLPRRTDGYAPRCLVAESVADRVRERKFPRRVRVFGARWDGGRWSCRYARQQDATRAVCRKAGQRVKLTLSAR